MFDEKVALHGATAGLSAASPKKLPVLMMHGLADSMIQHSWGKTTATNLLLRGVDVRFESYEDLDHEIGEGELAELMSWMVDLRDSADRAFGRPMPEREDPLQAEWERVEAASRFEAPLGTGATRPRPTIQGVASGIKYTIEPIVGKSSSSSLLRFPVPADIAPQLIPLLTARPILACGGMFTLEQDPSGVGVVTEVQTSDPENLAKEISVRIANRVTSGGASLDACPIS